MATLLPVSKLDSLNYFDSILDEMLNTNVSRKSTARINNRPPANIIKNKSGYQVDIAAPGLSREDFKISVEKNMLTISAKTELKKENIVKREFGFSNFSRSFVLSEDVSLEKISARYDSGILNIDIPMNNDSKPFFVKVD